MPRVNRDLQRRMAARRERERRRPATDRRYRFAAPVEPTLEPDDTPIEDADEAGNAGNAIETPSMGSRPATSPPAATPRRNSPRAVPSPFSAYTSEYAYVLGDLRRVGLVVGSLLVILILLYFVLPH